jgi:BON domain-containing protein
MRLTRFRLASALIALATIPVSVAHSAPFDLREWLSSRPSESADRNRVGNGARSRDSGSTQRTQPTRQLTDWEIATCVRTALWQDKELAPLNLQVSVEQGVATVDGPVPSDYLRRKTLAVVQALRGIRGVRDHLHVHSSPVNQAPNGRHFPPVDQPWPKRGERIEQMEMPLKAPPTEKPVTRVIKEKEPSPAEVKPAQPISGEWRPATGQGYWMTSGGSRAGLLPPVSSQFGPNAANSETPKVGLGQPVRK